MFPAAAIISEPSARCDNERPDPPHVTPHEIKNAGYKLDPSLEKIFKSMNFSTGQGGITRAEMVDFLNQARKEVAHFNKTYGATNEILNKIKEKYEASNCVLKR
jgi:hypothetical protein